MIRTINKEELSKIKVGDSLAVFSPSKGIKIVMEVTYISENIIYTNVCNFWKETGKEVVDQKVIMYIYNEGNQ
jgi:hypothetical protein